MKENDNVKDKLEQLRGFVHQGINTMSAENSEERSHTPEKNDKHGHHGMAKKGSHKKQHNDKNVNKNFTNKNDNIKCDDVKNDNIKNDDLKNESNHEHHGKKHHGKKKSHTSSEKLEKFKSTKHQKSMKKHKNRCYNR